jgi:hypothetical protein
MVRRVIPEILRSWLIMELSTSTNPNRPSSGRHVPAVAQQKEMG